MHRIAIYFGLSRAELRRALVTISLFLAAVFATGFFSGAISYGEFLNRQIQHDHATP